VRERSTSRSAPMPSSSRPGRIRPFRRCPVATASTSWREPLDRRPLPGAQGPGFGALRGGRLRRSARRPPGDPRRHAGGARDL